MAETTQFEQEYYEDNLARLHAARMLSTRKKILSSTARRVAQKLNQEIAMGHETTAFLIATSIAAAKDTLDIAQLGFPIFSFFLALIVTYFIWGKGSFLKTKLRIILWVVGLLLDNAPLISVVPLNTIMVLWAWRIVHNRAGTAASNLGSLHTFTDSEIKSLDSELGQLENERD